MAFYTYLDKFVQDYTASVTTGNPDLFSGTGMGIAHYLQVRSQIGLQLHYCLDMFNSARLHLEYTSPPPAERDPGPLPGS